jgi:[acyl-carrier-protein] S-malonyltransferase
MNTSAPPPPRAGEGRIVWLFPGQGSQVVGMGRDLAEVYPEAKAVFDEADDILGFKLSALCFDGPKETLDDTINAQPALLTASVGVLKVLETHLALPAPAYVAGHSMGEYSALVAAGALTFGDGLRLVRERGRLMKQAGELNPGGMAAVIGAEDALVEEVCAEIGSVQVANYNSPGQVVISGAKADVDAAAVVLKARGVRRVIPLAVSIAAHSRLMEVVMVEFGAAVDDTPMRSPNVPVVANITARPLTDVSAIRAELKGQLNSPVRWVASVRFMIDQGVTLFVEIGPKDVLAGLVQRIEGDVEAISVGDVAGVENLTG